MTIQERIDGALAAIRLRDFARAVADLRALQEEVSPADMPWELLANAEAGAGNRAGALAALDNRLAIDSRNITALLLKGQLLEREGDSRAASAHYRAALNQQALTGGCPDGLISILAHGERYIAASQDTYAEYLRDTVGPPPTRRMALALDILAGKKQLYYQQPSVFHFPELPHRQFFEPEEFPWLAPVMALVPEMQAELAQLEAVEDTDFAPYVTRQPGRPAPSNPLLDDPAWSAYWFWRNGELVADAADRCPATIAALRHAPMPQIPARSPVAHWSRLQPGAHIRPHVGMLNTRLICHIPIRTAPGCTLRVGNEVRTWVDGVPLVFDDSIEHEARNDGPQARTVLLFEIWRPELSEDERAALAQLFSVVAAYSE